jgi:hypothetical protein
MKSIVFWDMTPCSPLSVNRRFGGTYRPHLQGRRNKLSKKPANKQVATLISSTLNMEAICSSETSVDTTDYTASYPRRWYSYIVWVSFVCNVFRPGMGSRDTSVGIATSYGLDGRGVAIWFPAWERFFSYPLRPDRFWGVSYTVGTRSVSVGV